MGTTVWPNYPKSLSASHSLLRCYIWNYIDWPAGLRDILVGGDFLRPPRCRSDKAKYELKLWPSRANNSNADCPICMSFEFSKDSMRVLVISKFGQLPIKMEVVITRKLENVLKHLSKTGYYTSEPVTEIHMTEITGLFMQITNIDFDMMYYLTNETVYYKCWNPECVLYTGRISKEYRTESTTWRLTKKLKREKKMSNIT